ncbi:hypothetical protein EDB92DRAFT_1818380 [Lactarius akahatsu]|uniref:UDP-N-acetylglucosamine kinase n=1 Tax=Lactarius akahatsu TaxID=416441 RepID=A0AAD4LCN1_9AGAM|nr:hypothetical protein EDB92DRAFT_1818380 [Lactarius akahatsu]
MSNTTGKSSQQTRKLFIQMSGAPGSGKCTTANPLARLINGVVIDHDILKSALLEKGISFDKAAEVAYHLDWTFAEAVIKQEHSVIVDSTCNYAQILSQGIALAQRYGYEYWYVEFEADNVGMLDERLRKSVSLRSQRAGVDCPPRDAGRHPGQRRLSRAVQKVDRGSAPSTKTICAITLELFRSFTAVKKLRVYEELAESITYALESQTEEADTRVLPSLKSIYKEPAPAPRDPHRSSNVELTRTREFTKSHQCKSGACSGKALGSCLQKCPDSENALPVLDALQIFPSSYS